MDRIPTNSKMTPAEQDEYRRAPQNQTSSLQVRTSQVSFSSISSSNPSPFSSNSRTPTPHPFFGSNRASSTSLGSLGYRGATTAESDSEDEAPVDLRSFQKMPDGDENLPPILRCAQSTRSDSPTFAPEEDLEGMFTGLGLSIEDLFGEPTPKNPKFRPVRKAAAAAAAPVTCGKRREMEGIQAITENALPVITGKKRSEISEGEFNPETQTPLPFQTIYRKRRSDSDEVTRITPDSEFSTGKKRRNADPSYETVGSSFIPGPTLTRSRQSTTLSQIPLDTPQPSSLESTEDL